MGDDTSGVASVMPRVTRVVRSTCAASGVSIVGHVASAVLASSAEKKMWPGWKMQSSYVYETPSGRRYGQALRESGAASSPCEKRRAAVKPSSSSGVAIIRNSGRGN